MKILGTAHLVGAVIGGGVGFSAAFLLIRGPLANEERQVAFARPATELRTDKASEASAGRPSGSAAVVERKTTTKSARLDAAENPPAPVASVGTEKASAELLALLSQESRVQKELLQSQKRIAELEQELGVSRERDEFDLAPRDWRVLGQKGAFKYRVPCSNPRLAPSEEVIDRLGLAPEDRAALTKAYENSAQRIRQQVLPLCASALGGRMDLAQAVGSDACVSVVLSTAKTRGEDRTKSAKRVAAVMAGDATVGEDFNTTDLTLLAFAEEASRFEAELAEAFGPDEAHRIAFSPELCFSKSIFEGAAPSSPAVRK